ncbi:MAG: NAD(P)/FAD-dependent oxidoreductase [Phycisphaerae bacterium]|nr:NAD(P)/FAD-dependent oxidoreductase [Phycisphaerae bacterium]MDD5380111.1 NAD(P)/FAD-dependent oxidoreductase [Phycisphaerae bacterium]
MERTKVCIIGAGPAGLMASIHCALGKVETAVFETNTTAGRKLLLTGGGRCNLTHTGSPDEIVRSFGPKGRFLSYCLHKFPPEQVRQFFRELGLESIVEKDGCVFPVTNRAEDVRDCLIKRAKDLNVRFFFDKPVKNITRQENSFEIHTSRDSFLAEKVIIATGGLSFPQTGSTGDGFRFAKELGHTIVEPKASLVPLVTRENWPAYVAGTAIENVKISARINNKKITTAGALVFTDDGIGGLAAWDMSRHLTDYLPAQKPLEITIDFTPAMNDAEFDECLLGLFAKYPKRTIINVLFDIVPKRLAGFLCRRAEIAETTGSQLKKEDRRKITQLLKKLPLSIVKTRPIAEAIITRGGVSTSEIDSKTMESKICPGLFFAGESLDADGPCGGYSLQMCWSTGALAGAAAAI